MSTGRQRVFLCRVMVSTFFFAAWLLQCEGADVATSKYFQAMELLTQGKYVDGIKMYYKFLITSDSLLTLDCRKSDLDKAQREVEKLSLISEERKREMRLMKSLLGRILHQWAQANAFLDELRKEHPNSFLLTFFKGEFLLSANEIPEAKKLFDLLEQNPKSKQFQQIASALLLRSGEKKGQDPAERRASLLKIAFRYLDAFQRERAEKLFQAIWKEFPEDPDAPRALVNLYMEEDKIAEAQKVLEGWKSSEGSLLPPLALARYKYRQRKFPEVIRALADLREKDPGNEYAKSLIAESLFQTGEYAKAADLFLEMHRQNPRDQGLLSRTMYCMEESGRAEEVIPLIEGAIASDSRNVFLKAELGALFDRLGRTEKAKEIFTPLSKVENPYREYAQEKLMAYTAAEQKLLLEGQKHVPVTTVSGQSQGPMMPAVSMAPVGPGGGGSFNAPPPKEAKEKQLKKQVELMKRLSAAYD